MSSNQIVTSKEKAVILDGLLIFLYVTHLLYFIYFYPSLACLHIPKGFFPVVLSFPFVKLWLSIPASNWSPVVIYTGLGIITAVSFSCCCIQVCESPGYVKEPRFAD